VNEAEIKNVVDRKFDERDELDVVVSDLIYVRVKEKLKGITYMRINGPI